MTKTTHVHKWNPTTRSTLLYAHRREKGEWKRVGAATGRDDFKQRVCKCGASETYDVERQDFDSPFREQAENVRTLLGNEHKTEEEVNPNEIPF